jgi:transcriptional regulator with XRE-family HTH domain
MQPYPENRVIIGEKIRALRVRRRISQRELAEQIGLVRSSVANIESGRQACPLDGLQRIADALDIRLIRLVDGKPFPRITFTARTETSYLCDLCGQKLVGPDYDDLQRQWAEHEIDHLREPPLT